MQIFYTLPMQQKIIFKKLLIQQKSHEIFYGF
jgi:hypothetical protein